MDKDTVRETLTIQINGSTNRLCVRTQKQPKCHPPDTFHSSTNKTNLAGGALTSSKAILTTIFTAYINIPTHLAREQR